jgi:hypothetical protein
MQKYKVIDLQNTNFMDDTHDNPMTLKELRERFWGLCWGEDMEDPKAFKDFSKEYIEDLWEVRFEEVN